MAIEEHEAEQEEPKNFVHFLADLAIKEHEAEQEEPKSFVNLVANMAIEEHEAEQESLNMLAEEQEEPESFVSMLANMAEENGIEEVVEEESFVDMLANMAEEEEVEQQAMPFMAGLAQMTVATAEHEEKQMEAVAELANHSVTDMLAMMTLQNGEEEIKEAQPVEEEQPGEMLNMFSTLMKADHHMKQLEEEKNLYEYDEEELLNTLEMMDEDFDFDFWRARGLNLPGS